MASGLGLVGMTKQAAYSSAKAAIIGLTRQMTAEYGPEGVRVSAVAPGLIETPATAERLRNDADYRASNIGSMPLGRAGQPSEVAAAAAFLCSEDASFATGHVLVVGGRDDFDARAPGLKSNEGKRTWRPLGFRFRTDVNGRNRSI
jgi:NAD(P)-dependent dehydrogenase (short-subunit alcohol dehydrogenase family)